MQPILEHFDGGLASTRLQPQVHLGLGGVRDAVPTEGRLLPVVWGWCGVWVVRVVLVWDLLGTSSGWGNGRLFTDLAGWFCSLHHPMRTPSMLIVYAPAHEDVAEGVAQRVVLIPKHEGARALVHILQLV